MEPAFFPQRDGFAGLYNAGQNQIVYQRIINDIDTPVSAYLKLAHGKPYAFLFESVQGGEQRGRYSFLGFAPDIIWRSQNGKSEIARGLKNVAAKNFTPIDDSPLQSLRQLQAECSFDLPNDIPPMAAGLFGYLGYDMVREVEHLPQGNPDVIGTPDAIMVRPTIIAIFDQIAQEIIFATPVDVNEGEPANSAYDKACDRIRHVVKDLSLPTHSSNIPALTPLPITPILGTDEATFTSRVQKAKEYVKAGDVFQVVIGQRLEADMPASDFALYRSLRRMNPSPFLYFLQFDDHSIVGSSPEILVRLRDGKVTIRPIAGTRPRGATPAADIAMEAELLADKKECSEHLMLLDLGRNDVGRVSKPGTINVTEKFIIERYSHVMHIVSNVEGELRDDLDAISALFAGFPAGTVSGAPKVRAMEIIDELETERRGIYGGAVGYISADGNMDTAIVLRTAIIKDGKLHVRAGAGIVMDSNPKMEFEETLHKSAALFRAAEHSPKFDRN